MATSVTGLHYHAPKSVAKQPTDAEVLVFLSDVFRVRMNKIDSELAVAFNVVEAMPDTTPEKACLKALLQYARSLVPPL